MSETIKQMRKRHEREIRQLQAKCPHPRISKWLPYEWAPAHRMGEVRVCRICDKTIKRRGQNVAKEAK